ncbi:MAG: hypothetical protein RLN67_08635, partial [Algiphilus sp.]
VAMVREPSVRVAALAARIGFDAYGLSHDMPDPVADALNVMLDHMQTLDDRVIALCERLREHGEELPSGELSPIEKPEFCREHEEEQAASGGPDQDEGPDATRSKG